MVKHKVSFVASAASVTAEAAMLKALGIVDMKVCLSDKGNAVLVRLSRHVHYVPFAASKLRLHYCNHECWRSCCALGRLLGSLSSMQPSRSVRRCSCSGSGHLLASSASPDMPSWGSKPAFQSDHCSNTIIPISRHSLRKAGLGISS